MDIAEARDLLSSAQLPYIPIAKPALGFKMLAAKRLEVFVSDTPPQPDAGPPPRKVLLLTPAERWLACNPDTPPPVLSKLRQALRAGLFARTPPPSGANTIWTRSFRKPPPPGLATGNSLPPAPRLSQSAGSNHAPCINLQR